MIDADDLPEKLKAIRRDIRAQYLAEDGARPWIIGFSGGKDSTLLTHLVVETLLAIAPDQRTRPVHLVCNDTLVESPVFHGFVGQMLTRLEENIGALNVPVRVVRTHPLPEESFWVNLLGRGYPAPNRTFRWCTDRMKIRPTSRFIREQVSRGGGAILLLGVRRDESAMRSGSISRHQEKAEGRFPRTATTKASGYSRPSKTSRPRTFGSLSSASAPRGAAPTTRCARSTRTPLAVSARSSSATTTPLPVAAIPRASAAGLAPWWKKITPLNRSSPSGMRNSFCWPTSASV